MLGHSISVIRVWPIPAFIAAERGALDIESQGEEEMDIYEGARGADYQLTKKCLVWPSYLIFCVRLPSNTTDQAARNVREVCTPRCFSSLSYTFDAIEGKKPPTGAEIRRHTRGKNCLITFSLSPCSQHGGPTSRTYGTTTAPLQEHDDIMERAAHPGRHDRGVSTKTSWGVNNEAETSRGSNLFDTRTNDGGPRLWAGDDSRHYPTVYRTLLFTTPGRWKQIKEFR